MSNLREVAHLQLLRDKLSTAENNYRTQLRAQQAYTIPRIYRPPATGLPNIIQFYEKPRTLVLRYAGDHVLRDLCITKDLYYYFTVGILRDKVAKAADALHLALREYWPHHAVPPASRLHTLVQVCDKHRSSASVTRWIAQGPAPGPPHVALLSDEETHAGPLPNPWLARRWEETRRREAEAATGSPEQDDHDAITVASAAHARGIIRRWTGLTHTRWETTTRGVPTADEDAHNNDGDGGTHAESNAETWYEDAQKVGEAWCETHGTPCTPAYADKQGHIWLCEQCGSTAPRRSRVQSCAGLGPLKGRLYGFIYNCDKGLRILPPRSRTPRSRLAAASRRAGVAFNRYTAATLAGNAAARAALTDAAARSAVPLAKKPRTGAAADYLCDQGHTAPAECNRCRNPWACNFDRVHREYYDEPTDARAGSASSSSKVWPTPTTPDALIYGSRRPNVINHSPTGRHQPPAPTERHQDSDGEDTG